MPTEEAGKAPLTGLFESLTPDQKQQALEYCGPENHGDPDFPKAGNIPVIEVEWCDPFILNGVTCFAAQHNGGYLIVSNKEPMFCLFGKTLDEAKEIASRGIDFWRKEWPYSSVVEHSSV